MRAFLSLAVVIAFMPLLATELSMNAAVMESANEIRRMQYERIAYDEFRYGAEGAFLSIAREAVNNPDPEKRHWTAACAELEKWALNHPEAGVAIGPRPSAFGGNGLVFAECALFLDVGNGYARLGPKCGLNDADFGECVGKLLGEGKIGMAKAVMASLAAARGGVCFAAEKEINGNAVTAVVRGVNAYESAGVA